MAHNEHYKHFPPEFEPYKICNNAFCSGNLQQIFQYVARRKHKGNEVQDLKKALDFLQYEDERRTFLSTSYEKQEAQINKLEISEEEKNDILHTIYRFPSVVSEGVYILNKNLHNNFKQWCIKNDPFLGVIYSALTDRTTTGTIHHLIKTERNFIIEQTFRETGVLLK